MEDLLKRITWLGHSGLLIEGPKTIYFDPFEVAEDLPKADLIFLTHSHYDHCSKEDVEKISSPETQLAGPADCMEKFPGARTTSMSGGEIKQIAGISVKAIPAYTVRRPHHRKDKNGLGFLIEIEGVRLYHAGDTDSIRELDPFPVDIAFFPVDNLFTMGPDEAVAAALHLKPKIVLPIHFGSVCGRRSDAGDFVVKCRNAGLNADVLRKTRFGRPQQVLPSLSPRLVP